ncbi:MAG: DUF485 domain-containing protein [Rhodocyclaceae bacterium]|jgi:uncharacterized membrane protein (DUF485 family)|nr:DUF485 domain-containing protein [Rhodocyclaceae bacterium]
MAQETWDRIRANPKFQAFVKKRNTYSIIMTALGALAYYGFILLVAYDKEFLATRLGAGVTTIGIPLGVGVIVFTIILTWIYVGRANSEFDAESEAIVKEATR